MIRYEPGQDTGRTLVFLPGFMTAPDSYSALLQPLAAQGVRVVVPSLYPRGLSILLGRVSVIEEAERAAA